MDDSNKAAQSLYLTFRLEDEIFAFEVEHLREVLDMCPITKIPNAQEFMRGVINVRGSVVPVLDMRSKFGLPPIEKTINTRIIIIEIPYEGKRAILGAIADSVEDVLEIDSDQIDDAPDMGSQKHQSIMKGIGKKDDNFIIILDIEKLFKKQSITLPAQTPDGFDPTFQPQNPNLSGSESHVG